MPDQYRINRRTVLADLGRGAVAVAVVGLAACGGDGDDDDSTDDDDAGQAPLIGAPASIGEEKQDVRPEGRVAMPSGTMLVLYTDGLVEDRKRDMDSELQRLEDAVRHAGPHAAVSDVSDAVLAAMTQRPLADDAALLIVRVR